MKDESEPASADEWVVRIVWHTYVTSRTPPVSGAAFEPRDAETDGIRIFRLACMPTANEALLVIAPEKRSKYAIALLSVADLASLGLSVLPSPIAAIAGHAVIPEVNRNSVAADRTKWKALRDQLARLASQNLTAAPTP